MNERILVISHAHPDFSLGGGEIAAYAHWRELRSRGIEAMFLARSDRSAGHAGAPFSARSADGLDQLFTLPPVDHFRHSQPQRSFVYEDFRGLLDQFRPTVVHFHHYVHLGVELIREVHKYSPDIRIVLTLHEYLAICHSQGQMMKTGGQLCLKASPLDCHGCFPERTPQEFFMRELFVKSFLNLVDLFICPSDFLRRRYIAWGLPAAKLEVVENGQPRGASAEPETVTEAMLPARFAVLGQLSRLKGSFVLLDAVRLLPKKVRRSIRIEIHGSVQYQVDEFKERFESALADLADTVQFCGPYRPDTVGGIIRRAGWIIVPSIWWENSPLVIQEAFAHGRPVICSDIGGMAEKVRPGIDGLHFRAGSASDLASCLEWAAADPARWDRLKKGVPAPPSVSETVDRLLDLYDASRPAAMRRRA